MLIKDLLTLLPESSFSVTPATLNVDSQVHAKLNQAAEEDDIDAQCFGLEMEDGKVVKVYVLQSDADAFEEALSDRLGQDDDIKTALEELGKQFEIVNVVWPEGAGPDDVEDLDDDKSDVDVPDQGDKNAEFDSDKLTTDGSESLNPNVPYQQISKESLGSAFASKILSSIREVKLNILSKPEQDEAKASEDSDDKEDGADSDEELKKSSWEVEKEESGEITLTNKKFKVEFDRYEGDILSASFRDKKIARFKNDNGQVVYVFAPRGEEYLLKTPDYPHGIRVPKDVVKKVMEE